MRNKHRPKAMILIHMFSISATFGQSDNTISMLFDLRLFEGANSILFCVISDQGLSKYVHGVSADGSCCCRHHLSMCGTSSHMAESCGRMGRAAYKWHDLPSARVPHLSLRTRLRMDLGTDHRREGGVRGSAPEGGQTLLPMPSCGSLVCDRRHPDLCELLRASWKHWADEDHGERHHWHEWHHGGNENQ